MEKLSEKKFQASLLQFIAAMPRKTEGRNIHKTTPLFDKGLIDSLQILDLIAFVESTLGLEIPDREITAGNFRSVQAITTAFWERQPKSKLPRPRARAKAR